jgi:hypothetical protein
VEHKYPDDLGFAPEILEVWNLWRGNRITEREPSADERAGMDWWNLLPESGRAAWLAKAQSAKPSDAWAPYSGKSGQGEKPKGFVPLTASGGRIAAVHPEAGCTWLCVQHEEDGANACTCADESI